jgi:gamma-glutamyltranspeptidase / glutathione hydrolase
MAPTVVLRAGSPEIVVGSAGSNRIRSAITQTILRVLDDGLRAEAAVQAPRLHAEDGVIYAEPGIDVAELEASGRTVARFREANLFFGGVQLAERTADGSLHGAGDHRRGGAAIVL